MGDILYWRCDKYMLIIRQYLLLQLLSLKILLVLSFTSCPHSHISTIIQRQLLLYLSPQIVISLTLSSIILYYTISCSMGRVVNVRWSCVLV